VGIVGGDGYSLCEHAGGHVPTDIETGEEYSPCTKECEQHNGDCKICSGTGIDIPLEFGCEVLHKDEDYGERLCTVLELQKKGFFTQYTGFDGTYKLFKSFRFDDSMGKWQNLGKPSTLEDLLRALPQLELEFIDLLGKNLYISYEEHESIKYDLSKTPETQTQEVTNQLIEILS